VISLVEGRNWRKEGRASQLVERRWKSDQKRGTRREEERLVKTTNRNVIGQENREEKETRVGVNKTGLLKEQNVSRGRAAGIRGGITIKKKKGGGRRDGRRP